MARVGAGSAPLHGELPTVARPGPPDLGSEVGAVVDLGEFGHVQTEVSPDPPAQIRHERVSGS
jgi:hypothetical protein